MSIPTKGTRKITVYGEKFIWLIRRKATYSQQCEFEEYLHVAIQDIEQSGSTLI